MAKMHLAYCRDCAVIIGTAPAPVKGSQLPSTPYRHTTAKGVVHVATLVEVPETPILPQEAPGAYLGRLLKTHKKALK